MAMKGGLPYTAMMEPDYARLSFLNKLTALHSAGPLSSYNLLTNLVSVNISCYVRSRLNR